MKRKILIIASFLTLFLSLSSCLKDDVGLYWTDDLKGKMYAEVWRAGFTTTALQPTPDPVIFKFLVNIATDQPPTEDITVTLAIDETAMNRYNASKNLTGAKAYKLYPYIQILDQNLVIKAGTRNAYAHVKVWNANLLNACDNFMAPIVIQSATGGVIPADPLNQGARLMGLPIANPYAGTYHTVGYRLHPSLGVLPVDAMQTASTVDCKTIIKSGFGDYPYDIKIEVTDQTITVLGVACKKILVSVIDPGTGAPVDSGTGMYTTFTGSAGATPTPPSNDVNYYNPVTKQFVWNAYYNSAAPRIGYEIMTRQ